MSHFAVLHFSAFKDPVKSSVKSERKDKMPCLDRRSDTLLAGGKGKGEVVPVLN
jgi:hypothetical protein